MKGEMTCLKVVHVALSGEVLRRLLRHGPAKSLGRRFSVEQSDGLLEEPVLLGGLARVPAGHIAGRVEGAERTAADAVEDARAVLAAADEVLIRDRFDIAAHQAARLALHAVGPVLAEALPYAPAETSAPCTTFSPISPALIISHLRAGLEVLRLGPPVRVAAPPQQRGARRRLAKLASAGTGSEAFVPLELVTHFLEEAAARPLLVEGPALAPGRVAALHAASAIERSQLVGALEDVHSHDGALDSGQRHGLMSLRVHLHVLHRQAGAGQVVHAPAKEVDQTFGCY